MEDTVINKNAKNRSKTKTKGGGCLEHKPIKQSLFPKELEKTSEYEDIETIWTARLTGCARTTNILMIFDMWN